jgi:hypothetical protein
VKALTIKQPWVHAILHEGKDIENRSWQSSFRGWPAIHASAQPKPRVKFPRGIRVPDLKTLYCSAICGVARVVDIVTRSSSKWFNHPDDGSINYGWVRRDVKLTLYARGEEELILETYWGEDGYKIWSSHTSSNEEL